MGRSHRSWLPEGVVKPARLDNGLTDVLADWSAKWFVGRVATPKDMLRLDRRPAIQIAGPAEVLAFGDDLALGLAASARAAIARVMMGMPERANPETDADRDLVKAVSQACLDDLCRRIATMIGLDPDRKWGAAVGPGTGWTCDIAFGAEPALMRLTVSEDAMVAAALRAMPPAAAGPPLGSIADALRRQPIEVSARLGESAIPLADFAGLGIGDVVVLDRAASAAVDLAVDGHPLSGLPCSVTQAGDAIALTLQHSLHGHSSR